MRIKDRASASMDDLCNVSLVEDVLRFMTGVDTYDVNKRIKATIQCLHLMKTYTDIPEVWVREVHVAFSNIGGLLAQIKAYHESNHTDGAGPLYLAIIDPLHRFEHARLEWLDQHPQELEFVFQKMRLLGFSDVKNWGVTDCLQFEAIKQIDRRPKLKALKNERVEIQVTALYKMIRDGDPDLLSVRKIYEDNDVYSMHLRRQLIKLHEYINGGKYHPQTTTTVSAFLHTVAYKLWGWGDFVKQSPDAPPKPREAYVVEVTGAPGGKAISLNGMYVETKEEHNELRIFKKTSMYKGDQLWLRANSQHRWIVSLTADVKENNGKGLCSTLTAGIAPIKKQWKVYDAEADKLWKEYPAMQCQESKAAQLLWTLDDCDVVVNALPAIEIEALTRECRALYIKVSELYWPMDTEHPDHAPILNIIEHLEGVGHALQKTLTARQTDTPVPGECSICMDRQASEILLSCNHVCVCSVCLRDIQKSPFPLCPLCRSPIEASCNYRVYATRTSHSTERVFYGTVRMRKDARMKSLLLQLRDLHERV